MINENARNHWPDRMNEAWDAVDSTSRFHYVTNGALVGFILFQVAVIWGFFAYTALSVHLWTMTLTSFLLVYVPLTIFVLGTMFRWRAFCVMSAVVVGSKRITWMCSGEVQSADLSSQRIERMGFERIAEGSAMQGFLTLDIEGKESVRLDLFRPYARLSSLEHFMEVVLKGVGPSRPERKKGKR
jgi:hypothetical protein